MKYLTDYAWRKKDNSYLPGENSILLQQITYGTCNVVLACICGNGKVGGYITGGLKNWLMNRGEMLFGKAGEKRNIEKELEKILEALYSDANNYLCKKEDTKISEIELSGILLAGHEFWVILGQKSNLILLNRKFQKTHYKQIYKQTPGPFEILPGHIQKSVGVLLGNYDFLGEETKDAVIQCLAPWQVVREEQIASRLKELTEESHLRGRTKECAVIYIRSV